MVCNNSTIKHVLNWTLACKVSRQEKLPFQTKREKKTPHENSSLIISRMNLVFMKGKVYCPKKRPKVKACCGTRGALQLSSVVHQFDLQDSDLVS